MIQPEPSRRPGTRYWITLTGVSLGASLAVAIIHASPAVPRLFMGVLARSLIYSATIAGIGGACVPRIIQWIAPRRSAGRWVVIIFLLLALAVVGTLVAGGIIEMLGFWPNERFWVRFREDLRVAALLAVGLGVGISLFEALRRDLEATTAALHAREIEEERMRKLAVEARLASLEARLHPHFLFNALNAISALIAEDPQRAERMVERLAALLRFALDAGQRGLVPLAEELKLVGDYLEIEKARLGDRLSYTIDVETEVDGCAVPPLSVQTLAENSIKHAIAPRPSGGSLRIDASAAGHRVVVRVWDDGPGFALDGGGPGHGLDNLQGRLAERFGNRAALTVTRERGGTAVALTLPRSTAGLSVPA